MWNLTNARGAAALVSMDPLLACADRLISEARQLGEEHRRLRERADAEVQRMVEISRILDPMLPHPPEEARRLRQIVASIDEAEPE